MSSTLLDVLTGELTELLQPILDGVDDPWWFEQLLVQLGTTSADAGDTQLIAALTTVATLKQQIDSLTSNPSPSFAGIANLLKSLEGVFDAFRALSASGGPAASLATLGEDLVQLLFGLYLSQSHPLIYSVCVLLTLIDPADEAKTTQSVVVGGNVVRSAVSLPRFHLDRLPNLVRDPVGLLRTEYVNDLVTVDDANAMADKLFGRLSELLTVLGVPYLYGFDAATATLLGDAAPLVDHAFVVYVQAGADGATADAGVTLTFSPAARGDLGLVVCPFGTLTLTGQLGKWTLQGSLTAEIEAFAYGHKGVTIAASLAAAEVDGSFTATLAAPPGFSGPAFIFGSANGSRLEIGGAVLKAQTSLTEAKQTLALSAEVSKSTIVISSGDGDGFLQSVLPAGGMKADFDLGLAWSNTGGLSFSGAAGLDATLPVGISIGGVATIPTIHLGLQAGDAGVLVEVSASIGLSIGPVQALVDRLGLTTNVTFPDSGGNLGIADLDFSFKPPSGVGLAIDSAGVTGGGVLSHDDAKHEYSGMLQLEFNDLALQAYGLITTQVAGGSGYSLLALVDANFPPEQLGWGFTLNGVGGLLAIHRTADTDKLRAALKADKLATILFPKNAISNAPLVLAQLDALFPTAQGRFLFGPMALIGWGTPTVLTVALAVILELPEPVRIILLARLSARLPSVSAPLVKINMDALGVLDLTQDSLSLDATLYDSKIVGFTLGGDMALRANWGTQREFLLAIGGFHPQFTPPTGFPTLQRITIDMPSGAISKLRLAAYLALTSNTVQFGANLDVFIGVSGFGLAGHLGFDAMLQIDPFHFDADISGSVALMAGGDTLMSVGLDASLDGPAPWHIAGNFKIHVLFFDVHKSFSATWGDSTPALPIPAVEVLPLLTAAFADERNWGTSLPANAPALVSLRSRDGTTVIAHPLALLNVHERIVPLGLQITRFGAAAIFGATTFTITDFHINQSPVGKTTLQDDFAPAQFFDLTDVEKLSGPSFERYDAGISLIAPTAKTGSPALVKAITYETFYVDEAGGELREDSGQPQTLPFTNMTGLFGIGASGRAAVWKAGNRKYGAPGKPVTVTPQSFTIATTTTLQSAGIAPATGVTYTAAKALLRTAVAAQPSSRDQLQIVALHEMAAA